MLPSDAPPATCPADQDGRAAAESVQLLGDRLRRRASLVRGRGLWDDEEEEEEEEGLQLG